jgi:hypothetical protein
MPPASLFISRMSKAVVGGQVRLPQMPKWWSKAPPPEATLRRSCRIAGLGAEQQL